MHLPEPCLPGVGVRSAPDPDLGSKRTKQKLWHCIGQGYRVLPWRASGDIFRPSLFSVQTSKGQLPLGRPLRSGEF